MIDPKDQGETFLQRWSRLKQAAEAPTRNDSEPPLEKTSDAGPEAPPSPMPPSPLARSGVDLAAFDPTTLPPIESISASSDIRAFLAPGVPEGIKRAALRRAWVMDPAIRDFVGVAENQWDFSKPDSIPGFGSLELTPELCRMVADLFSDLPADTTQPTLADTEPREQIHVHDRLEPPSSRIASASLECDPKTGRSLAQVEEIDAATAELASSDHPKDEASQPTRSKQKTSTPK